MKDRRFTVRTLMLSVLAASLAIWSCMMWRRSTHFAREAEKHSLNLGIAQGNLYNVEYDTHSWPRKRIEHLIESQKRKVARLQAVIRYEEPLYRKYRRAARFPWLSVDEDPPPIFPPY